MPQSNIRRHVQLSSGMGPAKYGHDYEHGGKYGPPHVITISLNINPIAQMSDHYKGNLLYSPTQYASILIQVHSQLLTAIEKGLLECDQVASTPTIYYHRVPLI